MKKQLGIADLIMLSMVFAISIASMYLANDFNVKFKKSEQDYVEQMVMKEALAYESVSRAVGNWFNLKGKGIIYACESINTSCDLNNRKNILPTYYSNMVNDSFLANGTYETLGMSSPFPFQATVVKKNDVPTGYDYEIIVTYID